SSIRFTAILCCSAPLLISCHLSSPIIFSSLIVCAIDLNIDHKLSIHQWKVRPPLNSVSFTLSRLLIHLHHVNLIAIRHKDRTISPALNSSHDLSPHQARNTVVQEQTPSTKLPPHRPPVKLYQASDRKSVV